MTSQVRPENRKACGLIQLDAQIQEPRAVAPVSMQENDGRRSFRSAQQPSSSFSAVAVGPGFICYFESRSAYVGERLRGDEVSLAWGARDSNDNEAQRGHKRHNKDKQNR